MENRESEYYLGVRNVLPVTVSVKIFCITYEVELPWDTTGVDVLEAVYHGLCLNSSKKHVVLNAAIEFIKFSQNPDIDTEFNNLEEFCFRIEHITFKTSEKIIRLKFDSSVVKYKTIFTSVQSALIGLGFETESDYECFRAFVDNNRIYDEECGEDIIPQEDDEADIYDEEYVADIIPQEDDEDDTGC